MIGDGMGPQQVELGKIIEYGPDGESVLESFAQSTRVNTKNVDGILTDSAASGTAIATGVKTSNGRVGVNYDASMDITTILEIAESHNYSTGLVATAHITHATPAVFAAHEGDRGDYKKIAEDMANSGVDLLLGGGNGTSYFGNQIETVEEKGYEILSDKGDFESSSSLPAVGLLTESSLPREDQRNPNIVPPLSELVEKAIELLSSSEDPFFLMVEGSQIDWAGHGNNKTYMAHEVIEFEKAVRVAKIYAQNQENVQLLVTADHETGGLSIKNYDFTTTVPELGDSLEEKRTKRTERAAQVSVGWSTGGHTNTKVPLVGLGPYADQIPEANHHTDTFSLMRLAIEGVEGPVGEGFYKGHVSVVWWYTLGGLAALFVLGYITRFVVKKIKAKKKAKEAEIEVAKPSAVED